MLKKTNIYRGNRLNGVRSLNIINYKKSCIKEFVADERIFVL